MPRFPAVVLAAGASTRMGRPKALVLLPDGARALDRVIAACREGGCDPVLVVTGSDAEAVGPAARAAGAVEVENPSWARGRSTSVKAALPHLPPGAAGFLLHPVDHPLVEPAVVRALLAAAAEHPGARVVLPVHGGRRGHPAWFGAGVLPEIAVLGDDEPLHGIVRRGGVVEVPVASGSVLRNLDRPEDLP